MSNTFLRYEILLPLRFNDGQAVPEELVAQTLLDIRRQFGAVSSETQIIRGIWEHQNRIHRDELTRIFVDVPDTPENLQFFEGLKYQLRARFQQIDIWITSSPIKVV